MKPESLKSFPVHLWFEKLTVPRTPRFGSIHGDVCVAQHSLRILAPLGGEGNADARRRVQLFGIRVDRSRDVLLNALSDGERCLVTLDCIENDGKFIATEPGRDVGGAQTFLDAPSDFYEKGIPGRVPQAVVH
jgi:hypothetical protein